MLAGLVGGTGKVLSITTAGSDKVAVLHRWSDHGDAANDVVTVYNMQRQVRFQADRFLGRFLNSSSWPQLFPRFELAGIPYDGTLTVRFNGDYSGYSDLYNSSCVDPGVFRRGGGFAAVKVVGGAGVLCVPPMSMLVLTRA